MIKAISFSILVVILPMHLLAQGDSVRVLKEDEFIAAVKAYHPIAKQGSLMVDIANAQLTAIRGNFDPVLQANNDKKTLDGKNYYNYTNGELMVPTWYGIEVKGGFERNYGDLINIELTPGKSSYMGVTIPLAKNLVIDKRRASLQQAKLFTQQSEQERRIVINDLLLDAYQTYWSWSKDYQVYRILTNAVLLNQQRMQLIRISFEQGDRAKIDTIEAMAQLQNLQQQWTEAELKYRKSSFALSNFLWTETNEPAFISDNVIPDSIWTGINTEAFKLEALDRWMLQVMNTHPKLQATNFKINSMQVEKRLKFQSLLPKVDVKYNFLQKGYEPWKNVTANLLDNNYKFGLGVSMPLFLRQGRGEWKTAKLKLQSTTYERQQQQLEIENKVRYYYTEIFNLQQQAGFLQTAYNNYNELFKAEELRFGLGETTLFMLNSRQNQLLTSQQKLLEIKAKFFIAQASLQWAAGSLQ
ncbi:MAG: TolC family protein [Sphingobacteriales bacterium]|nr:TolC family protein [Sphingobacteriales bacterium]